MSCAFTLHDVFYSYGAIGALKNLTLQIQEGERVALLGANGSGKSTLLRLMAGLSFPQQGAVSFFGEPLTEAKLDREDFFLRFRRKVGVVFQNPDVQLFNASVFDEIAFGPLQMRWPRTQIIAQVEEQLDRMGIRSLRDRPPHRLSGGEKKRVALASVLVLDPEVILLDEPTAALDPNSETEIVQLMSSWRGEGRTVIIATHDLDTVETIADRCIVLKDGSLEGEGPPLAVLHDVRLLERSRLIRRQHHVHPDGSAMPHPHPHVHLQE